MQRDRCLLRLDPLPAQWQSLNCCVISMDSSRLTTFASQHESGAIAEVRALHAHTIRHHFAQPPQGPSGLTAEQLTWLQEHTLDDLLAEFGTAKEFIRFMEKTYGSGKSDMFPIRRHNVPEHAEGIDRVPQLRRQLDRALRGVWEV